MSRIAKTLPVSGKLYRNFAVVTVAITVCLAIFADGTTTETITEDVVAAKEQKSRANKVENADRAMRVSPKLDKTRGRFSHDNETEPREFIDPNAGRFNNYGPAQGGRAQSQNRARAQDPAARNQQMVNRSRQQVTLQLPPPRPGKRRSKAVLLSVSGGGETGAAEGMLVAIALEEDPYAEQASPEEITSQGLNRIFQKSRERSGGNDVDDLSE